MSNPPFSTSDSANGPELEAAQDYGALRSQGIAYLAELGSQIWTDYNVSDPGVTILEVLCYALTDLGYRTAFPMADLLAQTSTAELNANSFFTAAQILPSAAVSFDDLREVLMDQAGVANAWVLVGEPFEGLPGMRKLVIQPSNPNLDHKERHQLRKLLKQVFWHNRNLGEALGDIQFLAPQEVVLQLQVVVAAGATPETVLANALVRIDQQLQQPVSFHTLTDMLAQNAGDVTAVFEGPLLQNGFIAPDSLTAQTTLVDPDVLIRAIRDVEGLESVIQLGILPQLVKQAHGKGYFLQQVQSDGTLPIAAAYYPLLGKDLSQFQFKVYQGRKPYTLDMGALNHAYEGLQNISAAVKRADSPQDLPIPAGRYRNLAQYFTVQYDFPAIYNLGPQVSQGGMRASVAQMRGFLLLFDQVLTDYLAQLANLYKLFSWSSEVERTYYSQGLETAIDNMAQLLAGAPSLLVAGPDAQQQRLLHEALLRYHLELAELRESRRQFHKRRPRFLNHMMARLGRSLEDLLQQLPVGDPETKPRYYIDTMQRFLASYDSLSRDRGAGGDPYLGRTGLEEIVSAIFGLPAVDAGSQESYHRFWLLNGGPIPQQPLASQLVIGKEGSTTINFAQLMALGSKAENYHFISEADNPDFVGLSLYDPTISADSGGTYRFVNTYPDYETAQAAIQQSVAQFLAYSYASERLYCIDHILLKPFPEDPVHGLRVLDGAGDVSLTTTAWYPLPAIQLLGEVSLSNSTMVWGLQDTGPSGPWSSPPGDASPPLPMPDPGNSPPDSSPPTPPLGDPTFVFNLLAWREGQPYPVFPPNGIPLPCTPELGSPLVGTVYMAQVMHAYIQLFCAGVLDDHAKLGMALEADFMVQLLPQDFATSGKSELLEQWGKYGLFFLLQDWQQQVGSETTFPNVLAAACMAMALSNSSGSGAGSPPDSSCLDLLVQFVLQYYVPQYGYGPGLVAAVQQDLAPSPQPSALSNVNARAYLSCVGRALGASFLGTYFPDLHKEALGQAVAQGLGFSTDPNLDTTLGDLVAAFLQSIAPKPCTTQQGLQFLNDWLKAISHSVADQPSSSLAAAAWQLWTAWIDARSPEQDPQPSQWGALLGTYLAANPIGPEAVGRSTRLSELVATQIAVAMGYPHLQTSNYQPVLMVPSVVNLSAWMASPPEAPFADALAEAMVQTIGWYLRNVLAVSSQQDAAAKALLTQLGLYWPLVDESLWGTGDLSMDYYHEVACQWRPYDGTAVGLPLTLLFQPAATSTATSDVWTTIGVYALTGFLSELMNTQAAAGKTAGQVLLTQYKSMATAGRSSPPASPPVPLGSPPKGPAFPSVTAPLGAGPLLQAICAYEVYNLFLIAEAAANGWHLAGQVLSNLVGQVSIAEYLRNKLPPDATTATQIDAALLPLLQPKEVSLLSTSDQALLSQIGGFFLNCYLPSRFSWQWLDAEALGNAVLSLLGIKKPAPNPVEIPSQDPGNAVQYSITLNYQAGEIPVFLYSPAYVDSQAKALEQVAYLQSTAARIRSGTAEFGALFQPFYLPPHPELDLGPLKSMQAQPYTNRLTVIAPDWPVRFQAPGFQEQVELTVSQEAPAHFLCNCLWVNKQDMQEFEGYYDNWINKELDDPARDLHGQQILRFIIRQTAKSLVSS